MTPEQKDRRNVERLMASDQRDMLLGQALTHQERSTVWNALNVASRAYKESADEFRKVAVALRAGARVLMFADGEDGARAADRLAAQFDQQITDAEALMDRFE